MVSHGLDVKVTYAHEPSQNLTPVRLYIIQLYGMHDT